MFLVDYLTKIGLHEKEAKVYLAAIELGGGSVQELAQKSGLKRPTVYVVLDSLVAQGLVSEEKKGRGSSFVAASPEALKRKAAEQKKAIDEAFPFLTAMWTGEKSKPQVRVYEGLEGMKEIYRETLWKSKTPVWFF
ncbi:MAG: helix-turn-helix domain-containing protein, partial [Candidatus Magasanikbacteria bacterium]|nr:helix-turn-helix domain-containing protein [Candidatus Magasanikbacteria bacterium]